jgi:hypothetical protein
MMMFMTFALACWLQASCGATFFPLQFELVAEYVTVDYLWDSNHSRVLYEESGQFVVANNMISGLAVSKAGDFYAIVPRWTSGVPSSLNKLVPNPLGSGYVLDPWPSWEYNAINTSLYPTTLQNAQAAVIDSQNRMWVVEVGRTNFFDTNKSLMTSGAPALVVIDIATGQQVAKHYFPENVVSYNDSFVNDIRLDELNGYAYCPNAYADGGIIVFNLNTNTSRQFTNLVTQRNTSYDFCVNGICYGTSGIGAAPSDGISLSADLATLYWSPVGGVGLYSIATNLLWNFAMTDADFQSSTVFLGFKAGCAGGMLLMNNQLYYGNMQTSALEVVENIASFTTAYSMTPSDSTSSDTSPSTLNWIDTISPDYNNPNALYFTTNKLNLFFTAAMDFTGQSGANFRIYHAVPMSSSGTDGDDGKQTRRLILIIGFSCVTIAAIALFLYSRVHAPVPQSQAQLSHSMNGVELKIV